MNIAVYGSGSSGNAYCISDGSTRIMLECGVELKNLNRYSGYTLDRFDAVLTSHSHIDHSQTLYEMHKRGIPIYCTAETCEVYGLSGEGINIISENSPKFAVKSFIIKPFPLIHAHTKTMEKCECLGFLIASTVTKEKLLFATDTMYIPQQFKGLNYIMLETNYLEEYLNDGTVSDFIDQRRLQTHMSVETAVKFLKKQDLSTVKAVIGLHLSGNKTEQDKVLRALRRATGKRCYIAQAGLEVDC